MLPEDPVPDPEDEPAVPAGVKEVTAVPLMRLGAVVMSVVLATMVDGAPLLDTTSVVCDEVED